MRLVIVLGFEGVLLVRNAFEQSKTFNYCIHTYNRPLEVLLATLEP